MFIFKNVAAFLDCLSLGCLALQDALLSLKALSNPLTDTWTHAYRVYHVSGSMEARILLTILEKEKYSGQNKRRWEGSKQCGFCWWGGEWQLCEGWWEGAESWHRVGQRQPPPKQHCHYNSKNLPLKKQTRREKPNNPVTIFRCFHPSKTDGCYIILPVVLWSSSTNQKQGMQSLCLS